MPSRPQSAVTADVSDARASDAFWQHNALLFGAAFVAIISLAALMLILLSGRKGPAVLVADAAPIVTSDVAPMDTVRQRMTTGEDGRTFEFAINTWPSVQCFERINSVRPWRHPGWTNRGLDEANRILKFEYEVAGEALNCLFTENQERFCQASERAKMTKAVAFYLKKYRRDIALAKRSSTMPETEQSKMYKDLAERMKAMDPAGGDDDDIDDSKRLFAGIESVTSAGYFTAADFGGKSAPELAPHILPAEAKPCP